MGEGTVFTRFLWPSYYRTFNCPAFSIFDARCFLLVTVTGGRLVVPPTQLLCSCQYHAFICLAYVLT
jgi:hypothetical protein